MSRNIALGECLPTDLVESLLNIRLSVWKMNDMDQYKCIQIAGGHRLAVDYRVHEKGEVLSDDVGGGTASP